MLLREHARNLIASLQQRHGKCFASEQKKREMVAAKRQGLLPGARSIYRVEKQLERLGQLERKQVWPGDRMPDGEISSGHWVTCRLITRQERRAKDRARRKREGQRAAALERQAYDVAKAAELAAHHEGTRLAIGSLRELVGEKLSIRNPGQASTAPLSDRQAEIDRQLAAARAAGLFDEEDKPPD